MRNRLNLTLASAVCALRVAAEPSDRVERPLVIVSNPPPVQMLVPGFTVRELPLALNNVNNLVVSPDGRLFALCYDGNVFQLKDTNGDGLEDTATHFFDNERKEIMPSIGMTWGPGGLWIASRGRVIRLRDRGDGTGELETMSTGWPKPTAAAGSDLDAVGIAADAQGRIYFGLGCDAWGAAYRVDKQTGKSAYDIRSERGTVLKLSPDGKQREIICTGLRFTVSLAVNAAGDLFATDQEGATWLPNGNPFDELLHIQVGRHYGFPPRHPKYLPAVLDEPSLFDYGPQHQSTCGLHFNEPAGRAGRSFGPTWWRGDALVAGESRGKLWRTKLVKTDAGYVAQNNLIACLAMLTIDAVPTAQGDLLVACHSGAPDWGTGPEGKGKLFQISCSNPNTPQPVLVAAAGPTETRVVFDRPIHVSDLPGFAKQCAISMGRYVAAGDRFESIRPGYQVVKDQRTMPRFELPVRAATLSKDGCSLILEHAPRVEAVNYALTLPAILIATGATQINSSSTPPRPSGGARIPQSPQIDLLSDLTGVQANWRDSSGKTNGSVWLSHLDLVAARGLAEASAEHAAFFDSLRSPGRLVLRTQLDLWQMLRPAVQPGAKLDFEYAPETVTVVFKAGSKFEVQADANVVHAYDREIHLTCDPKENRWLPVQVSLDTGAGAATGH